MCIRDSRRRARSVVDQIAGAPLPGARVDSVLQGFISEPVPKLAGSELGRRCDFTSSKRTMTGRIRVPDDTAENLIHSPDSPVWASVRVGDYTAMWRKVAELPEGGLAGVHRVQDANLLPNNSWLQII